MKKKTLNFDFDLDGNGFITIEGDNSFRNTKQSTMDRYSEGS